MICSVPCHWNGQLGRLSITVLSKLLWRNTQTNTTTSPCVRQARMYTHCARYISGLHQLHYAHKCTDRQTNKLHRSPLNKVHSLILECRGELGEWLQQPSLGKDHQQDTAVSLLQEVQNLWHVFLLAGHFRPFVWLHLHGNIMIYKKCHIRMLYQGCIDHFCRSWSKAVHYTQS